MRSFRLWTPNTGRAKEAAEVARGLLRIAAAAWRRCRCRRLASLPSDPCL
jgi:hypothetical protein